MSIIARCAHMIAKCLLACGMVVSFPAMALAAQAAGYEVSVSPEVATFGERVVVTVSLKGYDSIESVESIRGLQVDITNIDENILTVDSYKTLIDDTAVFSNKASYNKEQKRVRLAYVNFDGTLPRSYGAVLEMVCTVNASLKDGGSITLPVKVLMQTETDQQVVQNSECVITYGSAPPVESFDVEWGGFEYVYSHGEWNPQTHSYDRAGWSDSGTGYAKVTNNTGESASVEFSFLSTRDEISGRFTDGLAPMEGPKMLGSSESVTAYLELQGKPLAAMNAASIGGVTVSIVKG